MKSLALKYRPTTWKDVTEQTAIKQILEEQIKTGTIKHGYLFCGGAGTGKTTSARIFSDEINEHKGQFIEIDAASNNGVDNVRVVIDDSRTKPINSKYKVYIIDEVHMLSIGAFNALLKTLEEPPAHVIFILATTDPQKIPATILSRVQRYDFQRISFSGIVSRLKYILDKENNDYFNDPNVSPEEQLAREQADSLGAIAYDYEEEALEYIAKIADGGMRDAITLLDKCLSYSNNVTMQNVIEALGTVDYNMMLQLTNSLWDMDQPTVIEIIEKVHRSGMDLKQFIKQYSYFVLDLCKYNLHKSFEYLQVPSTFQQHFDKYTEDHYIFFRQLLSTTIALNSNIKWETAPKPLIEATFLLLTEPAEEGVSS